MSAGAYDINCEQGATFRRELFIRDSAGDLIDLSGYTARMHVRRSVRSDSTIVELTTENEYIIIDNPGKIVLTLPASITAELSDEGIYDLEIQSDDGIVERVIEGKFNLKREVTR